MFEEVAQVNNKRAETRNGGSTNKGDYENETRLRQSAEENARGK